jgi:hypothetical protein
MVVVVTNVANARADAIWRIAFGVAVPLLFATVAYGLSWLSDQLLYIGPLDRAAFGWAVVIPVWLAGPPAAALAWRRLTFAERWVAAAVVGAVIGFIAGYLFWLSVAFPACETGAIFTPVERVMPSMILGAVVGAAPPIGGLVGSSARRGGAWTIAVRGAVAGLAVNLLAFAVLVTLLSGSACQRPHV